MQKEELLRQIKQSRERVELLWADLTPAQLEMPFDRHSDWTVKSLIAHLAFWELATLHILNKRILPEQLKDVHTINSDLLIKAKNRSGVEIIREFAESGERLFREIETLTDQQLQQSSPWNDGIPLIEHLADDTFLHYQEHYEKKKKWKDRQSRT